MAGRKITELDLIDAISPDDIIMVVDVSETDPERKNKQAKAGELKPIFPAFVTSQAQGDIPVGTQLQNKDLAEVIMKILSKPFAPMALSMDAIAVQEQGSTPTIPVKGTLSLNDEADGVTERKILRNGVDWQTFTGNSYNVPDTPTTNTTYEAQAVGGKSGLKTASRTVVFDLYHFYGPASALPTAATARNLAGKTFKSAGNTFTLPTGTVEKRFYIILAPGETLSSVIDQDALNLNITAEYVLTNANYSVNNAAGVPVAGYRLYEKVQGVAYSTNHRHNITIS